MELINFLGWFLLNIGVPLLAPLALLPLLAAGRQHRGKVKVLLRWAVQDGQLYWPVIAMCAAACHEAAGTFGQSHDQNKAVYAWVAISLHVLIIVVSSVLVSISTSDATAARHRDGTNALPGIVLISIIVAVITAVTYAMVHYYLAG
ncbi:hypothetical protein ASD15_15055 [Massilia sp. Root351]|uniref:hypothetical protein n=1 Tax=Massilia sp. Root351 TaxID=1736522 RepID=UPI00070B4382|nr:hypothetical protein [Massilia sp. Root351]KQV80187.1 hypothetical protein ASD15_15055 [Massilia sp. Root351]